MNSTGAGRVFATERQVRRQAERAAKRWQDRGLPRLTPHDARHIYASLMIAAGINAKALSTFMGHANIGITLDLYGHLMPGSQNEAAALLDAYLAREVGGSTSTITSTEPVQTAALPAPPCIVSSIVPRSCSAVWAAASGFRPASSSASSSRVFIAARVSQRACVLSRGARAGVRAG